MVLSTPASFSKIITPYRLITHFLHFKFMKKNHECVWIGSGMLKLLRIMKLTVLLLTLLFVQSFANSYAQNTKFNFSMENATIKEVIEHLEQESEFFFVLKEEREILNKKVNFTFENNSIEQVLDRLLEDTELSYKIVDKYIAITPDKEIDSVFQQKKNKIIRGKVSDKKGISLPGVSIVAKGTTVGSTTDIDGNYVIEVFNDTEVLVFSFVGMKTKEVTIADKLVVNLVMEEDAISLGEVVAVGYGSQSKVKVTGAISKIKSNEIQKYATGNFEQALSGKLAGVQITQNGRYPGEDSKITIRGTGTLTAGSDPLIVVDGVPMTEGTSLGAINSNDIESIDVLKDAASAAIYGSRAANGVLLITTKKGREGGVKINVNAYHGVQTKTTKLRLINAYDAAQFFKEARDWGYVSKDPLNRNASDDNATRLANGATKRQLTLEYTQPYLDGKQGLTDTDWMNEVYRPAGISNFYTSLSGGTKKTDYYVSFGYLNQEGIVIGSEINRFTSNIRINSDIAKWAKFGVNVNSSYSKADVLDNNGWNNLPADPGSSFYLMYPFFPVYNEDGSFAISKQLEANTPEDGSLSENTVAMTLLSKNQSYRTNVFGSTYLELELTQGLKFKSSLGLNFRNTFNDYYSPSSYGRYRTHVDNNQSYSTENHIRVENLLSENTLSYKKYIKDEHFINVLAGYSYQKEKLIDTEISASGIVDDNLNNIAAGTSFAVDAFRSIWTQISYFGRIQYDYSTKYLLSAAIRTDGSSRFGDNTKWGVFKSLSLGWVINREEFFPKNSWISSAKLRASLGETGNNQIGPYSSRALVNNDNYTINGVLVSGVATTTSPNNDLSWEKNVSLNFGVDLGFFKNKLSLTSEYYISNTKDLLLNVPVPQQSGYSSSLQNIGEVENRGIEFDLSGSNFKIGDFVLGFNANLSTNKSKVLALGPGQDQIIAAQGGSTYLTKIGGPIAEIYGYDILGVYKTQEEIDNTPHMSGTLTGDYIVRDADNDGDIDPDDRVGLGTYNPDFIYAFGANLSYKNFDLSFSFTGVEGRKVYDHLTARGLEVGEGFTTASQYYFDNRYHPENNPDGFFAQPNLGNFSSARRNTRMSSITVSDGDYLRLRSIQLGFNIPKSTINEIGFNSARLFVSATNLFTITKFRGLNSEGRQENPLTQGYVRSTASIPRSFIVGIDLNF